MTAGRVIDLAVARARLRGDEYAELEAEVEMHERLGCQPRCALCEECDRPPCDHAIDCSQQNVCSPGCEVIPARLRYFPPAPVTARPDPRVCGECGVGGGRHTAADCPRWLDAPAAEPVLTLAPALAPLPVQMSLDDSDVS